jgi:hypothetical protein
MLSFLFNLSEDDDDEQQKRSNVVKSLYLLYDVMPIKQHMQDSYVALLEIGGTGRLILDKGTRRRHHRPPTTKVVIRRSACSCRILTMVAASTNS